MLSEEDKKGIDDLILEAEKKIDIEKLNKKAEEIMLQKENKKKNLEYLEKFLIIIVQIIKI